MICKKCGTHNEDYLEFCKKCASELIQDNTPDISEDDAQIEPEFRKPESHLPPVRPNASFVTPVWAQNANIRQKPVIPPGKPATDTLHVKKDTPPEPKVPEHPVSSAYSRSTAPKPGQNPVYIGKSAVTPKYEIPASTIKKDDVPEKYIEPVDYTPDETNTLDETELLFESSHEKAKKTKKRPFFQSKFIEDIEESKNEDFEEQDPQPEDMETDDLFDDDDEGETVLRVSKRKPKIIRHSEDTNRYNSRTYSADDEPDEVDERFYNKKPHRKGLLIVLIAIASVAVIVIGGLFYISANYGGSVSAFLGSVFGGKNTVTVNEITIDGKLCSRITVYGKSGDFAQFAAESLANPIKKEYVGGVAIFDVVQNVWIPSEPTDSSLTVKPNVSNIDASGKATVLEAPDIKITVPKIEIVLSKPAQTSFDSDTPTVEIAGKVTVPTAKVYANDTELKVDAQGNFSGNYELKNAGANTVKIQAKLSHYYSGSTALNINLNNVKTIALSVNENVSLRSSSGELTISGKTEAGATVTVEGEGVTISQAPAVDQTGAFTFKTSIEKIGLYTLKISAKSNNGSADLSVAVERTPVVDEYSRKAYKMDYVNLTKYYSSQIGKPYVCVGKVVEIVQSNPYKILKLDVGTAGTKQLILIEYHGTAKFTAGNTVYKIFGDVVAKDQGSDLPKLYGWFAYKNIS